MNIKSFVLVHLGETFFDYINDCIRQIRKFNRCEIYLIINKSHFGEIEEKNIKLICPDDIVKCENHLNFQKNNRLDKEFRGGFWTYSTERLFYLEDLMRQYSLENIIHVENDTLIYFDYDEYFSHFYQNYDLATVFDNDERSVPCVIYIKKLEDLKKFNLHSLNYSDKNDMILFSHYRNYVNQNINLPIVPSEYNFHLESVMGHQTKNKKQYSNNFDKFNSIFDGAALGQFLGGVDPRNISGNTKGHINIACLFNPSNLNIFFESDILNRNIPFIKFNNKKYKINNLHVHSKNLKEFLS
jgi:hypothetical protein